MAKEITIVWQSECKHDKKSKRTSLNDVIPLASWTRPESTEPSHEERRQSLSRSRFRISFERKVPPTGEPQKSSPNTLNASQDTGFQHRSMTLPGRLSSHQRQKFRKKLNFFERTKKKLLDKNKKNDINNKKEEDASFSIKTNKMKTKEQIAEKNRSHFHGNEFGKKTDDSLKEISSSGCFCSGPSLCLEPSTNEVKPFLKRKRTRLRVLFDFEACEENDVSVKRGELVVVYNKEDQEWFWVETSEGRQGFVPRSYLWPCGCYVCQAFVLERMDRLFQDEIPINCFCCFDERKLVDVVKTLSLRTTWC